MSRRMAMTVPNTLRDCTRNAIVHCLNLPPPSRGDAAMTGGAMMYRNIMLNSLATQFIRMTTRSKIMATAAIHATT